LDPEFFRQGETISEFLESLKDSRAKFLQHLEESTFNESQQAKLARLPDRLNVLVIGEEWSGDTLYNLPVLFRMAHQKQWNVRVFRRDRYPDLILPYRKEGLFHSIPVIVFFDENFREIGRWIEWPAAASRMIDEESLKLRRRLREENKESWRQETIRELLDLLAG